MELIRSLTWRMAACKISVSLYLLNWIQNEKIFFYWVSELMLPTLIQRCNKNHFLFDPDQEWQTKWNFTGCHIQYFMIILIPYISLLNLFWTIKCLLLRNIEPLSSSSLSTSIISFLVCLQYHRRDRCCLFVCFFVFFLFFFFCFCFFRFFFFFFFVLFFFLFCFCCFEKWL